MGVEVYASPTVHRQEESNRLKEEITRHTLKVGKQYYSVVHVLTDHLDITTPDSAVNCKQKCDQGQSLEHEFCYHDN